MKQLTLDELIEALGDKPASIGERLDLLGVDSEIVSGFSDEVRNTKVYGSSFLKFLEDNRDRFKESFKIPTNSLPEGFVNGFDDGEMTIEERLLATGFEQGSISEMFNEDTLKLELTGKEFEDFIETNRDKFVSGIEKMVGAQ